MPRKTSPKKCKFETVVGGQTIRVILHPPDGKRTSWYVYWSGLTTSRSTEQTDLEAAKRVAVEMIQNGGQRPTTTLDVPTDEEFELVQQRHFSKKLGGDAQKRNAKSLVACMEAIRAFRDITGIKPITLATPDDCERFQHEALKKPRNWRVNYPKKRSDIGTLSPATVVKGSSGISVGEFPFRNGSGFHPAVIRKRHRRHFIGPWRSRSRTSIVERRP